MLYNFTIVERTGRLLFAYYFGAASIAQQDRWESALAAKTSPLWEASFRQDVPTCVEERCVVLRGVNDLVFIFSGDGLDDELELVEALTYGIECVRATCDKYLTSAQILSFHGKICVCVNEMFFGGVLVHTDVETVLRNAKFKPPKVS